jgi:hypothetical protein
MITRFHETVGIGAGIVDPDGQVICCAGFEPICTDFHRPNAACRARCDASHRLMVERLAREPYCEVACENGLRYAGAGVYDQGRLDACVVVGQFLREDDHVEEDFFLSQAGRFGFDRGSYIQALHRVPRRDAAAVRQAADHLAGVCRMLLPEGPADASARPDPSPRNETRGNLEFLRTLVDTIPSPLFYKDTDGRYLGCNHEFAEKIIGVDRSRILGKTLFEIPDVVPPSLARIYQEQDEKLIQRGGTQVYEAPVRCADGVLRYFEFHKSVYRDPAGDIAGIVGVMLDITQRVRFAETLSEAKEAAESANKAKSQFLANISHEIRTPMNGILGLTELALESDLTQQQRLQMGAVHQSAQSLMMVIEDILDFSRIDGGKVRLEVSEFQVRQCVVFAARMFAAAAAEKDLELVCRFDPKLPAVLVGDAGRLRQILLNLVGNAVKFTQSGRVVVSAELEDSEMETCLHVSVEDTGPGVASDQQEEIFGAFHQGRGQSDTYGGTGLGLAICSKLVDMMQGRMWLESRQGAGSTFHFTAKVGVLDSPAAEGPDWLADRDVLLISPREQTRHSVTEMFDAGDVRIVAVQSPREAQGQLGRQVDTGRPFSLVILDDEISRDDIESLGGQLGGNPALGRPPVLILAREDRHGWAGKLLGQSRWAEVRKPILAGEVLSATQGLLEPDEASPASAPQWGPNRSLRILVAEDNAVNQLLAKQLLTRWDHQVKIVGNGLEALLSLESESFDVVLMDIRMPEMDGLEATEAIRQREQIVGGHIPIVAMTAHVLEHDRSRCFEVGMDDYVSKPIDRSELAEALRRATQQHPDPDEPEEAPAGLARADVLADCMPETGGEDASGAPGRTAAAPAVDLESAIRRGGGDAALVREMAELFVEECPMMLQGIHDALQRGHGHDLIQRAHAMRGSLCNFSADGACQILEQLEDAARRGDLAGAQQAAIQLNARMIEVTAQMRSYIRSAAD